MESATHRLVAHTLDALGVPLDRYQVANRPAQEPGPGALPYMCGSGKKGTVPAEEPFLVPARHARQSPYPCNVGSLPSTPWIYAGPPLGTKKPARSVLLHACMQGSCQGLRSHGSSQTMWMKTRLPSH